MRIITAVAILLGALTPAWADKAGGATATEVVKEAIKAMGGEENLNKLKASSMSMKGDMTVQGLKAEFEGKLKVMLPDKFKMELDVSVMGLNMKMAQIMNGEKMKMTLNGMPAPLDDDSRKKMIEQIADQEISQLTPLLDSKLYTITSSDNADVDGKKAKVIVVNSEKRKLKDVKLFFDQQTHLLVKMQRKDENEQGDEVDSEEFFEDYKKVDGLMTPHKVVIKHDGKEYMKFTLSEIKHTEKLEASVFAIDD